MVFTQCGKVSSVYSLLSIRKKIWHMTYLVVGICFCRLTTYSVNWYFSAQFGAYPGRMSRVCHHQDQDRSQQAQLSDIPNHFVNIKDNNWVFEVVELKILGHHVSVETVYLHSSKVDYLRNIPYPHYIL